MCFHNLTFGLLLHLVAIKDYGKEEPNRWHWPSEKYPHGWIGLGLVR